MAKPASKLRRFGGVFQNVFDYEGLAFSTLDYNLWHATTTRKDDAGHGIDPSFDFQAGRTATGGTSFNFGLEDPRNFGGVNSAFAQPGSGNYIPGAETNVLRLLSGNQNLFGSYNLPGGAGQPGVDHVQPGRLYGGGQADFVL